MLLGKNLQHADDWGQPYPARQQEQKALRRVGQIEVACRWCGLDDRAERWSGIFDQFAASLSSGMGFMSGSGFQVLVGGIIGLSWRQQFAYLGDRLGINGTAERVPPLPDLVGAQPA
ncbi:hypothetical protein [Paracoccus actinidiae]|uniref:hypothetical protein n=1 Tax=Paracoccus actinidiae TaxID=3064531 RepID=UPI0027D2CF49|nr:hypothetical protein [Paracoccus sp. M09]